MLFLNESRQKLAEHYGVNPDASSSDISLAAEKQRYAEGQPQSLWDKLMMLIFG